jgi:hypothetical protein
MSVASDAWAVGSLVEHWNGHHWSVQPSPGVPPSVLSDLASVTALSPRSAWAVGVVLGSSAPQPLTLIEYWNRHGWHQQPSVSPGSENFLLGVTALTSKQAWAIGTYTFGSHFGTLVESWHDGSWSEPSTPGSDL